MNPSPRRSGNPATRAAATRPEPQETIEQYQRRVRRDRTWGGLLIALGVVVLALNYVMEVDATITLLPGGHNELYFLAGLVVTGYGAWIAFDLGTKRRLPR